MIGIFLLILACMIGLNYWLIKEGRTPPHLKFAIGRTIMMLVNSLAFYSWPEWGLAFAAQILAFGAPFNIALNALRRKPLLYLGEKPKNGKDYSKIDNFAHSFPLIYWFLLFWGVAAGIIIHINSL